jgi:hypothetical protein
MIFVLLYQCFSGFLAWFNYWLIKNNRHIYHALNGALHLIAASLIGYFEGWNYGVSCLLFTRVVFDFVLNAFRHLGAGYVSPHPASKVDELEKWVVFWLSEKIYKKKVIISSEDIEKVAIGVRIILLVLAIMFLFLD